MKDLTTSMRCFVLFVTAVGLFSIQAEAEMAYEGKGKVWIRAKWPISTGAYPGFCSKKRLGVFLLLPGWDASPSQGYPQP